MNTRRGLTMLSLSVALHAMLVLAVGGLLIPPEHILQHIEVDLRTTDDAPQSTAEAPIPAPAPTLNPELPLPQPTAEHTPVPKPIARPVKRPAPRPVQSKPVIKKIQPELTKPVAAPAKQPRTQTATPAETNPGTGSISNAGRSSTSSITEKSASGTGQKTDASLLQAYLAAVRARIEAAKRYPFAAEQRRIQGMVTMSFRLSLEGRLLGEPSISKSSGFSILDRAALRAIKQAEPFPRFPGPAQDMPEGPLSVELKFKMR